MLKLKELLTKVLEEIATLSTNAGGVASYVSNAQFANANGIRYEVRGKTVFLTFNITRTSGAAATSDFVNIATIPHQIDNNGANNAFYASTFNLSTATYALRFRPSGGKTYIDFHSANTTAGVVRAIVAFGLV